MPPGWEAIPTTFKHFRVGPLRVGEAVEVARLERLVFPEPIGTFGILRRLMRSNTRYLAVRDPAGKIAAYFGFELMGRYAHVISNATAPQHRRQGLAQFVLTAAEPLAKAMGASAFLGEVRQSNRAQLAVLATIGWERVAYIPHFFHNGEDAYIVWRHFG